MQEKGGILFLREMHAGQEETQIQALLPFVTPCSSSAGHPQEHGSERARPLTAGGLSGWILSNRLTPAEMGFLLCPPDLQIELIFSYFGSYRKC